MKYARIVVSFNGLLIGLRRFRKWFYSGNAPNGYIFFLQKRMNAFKNSLEYTINSTIPDGAQIALITFNETSHLLHDLVIVDKATRKTLVDLVRGLKKGGFRCIGCGLQEALKVISIIPYLLFALCITRATVDFPSTVAIFGFLISFLFYNTTVF